MTASKKKRPEWEEYCVGEPSSNPDRFNVNCRPLKSVYHIAHVSDAYRIFEDRRLRATLVTDESKLKETRSSVTWLSPNIWFGGSFYGNIRFEFDWNELIQGKQFYWVEVMHYSIVAYRILITDREPVLDLDRYRPEKDKGPLQYDAENNAWYCNGDFTGEFMFDGDLWLAECKTVDFVNHHDRTCKKDGPTCKDFELVSHHAGAGLLSRLIGQNVIHKKNSLRRLFLNEKEEALHSDAETAWGNILRSFGRIKTSGKLTHESEAASPLVAALLDRYGTGRDFKKLGSLFRNTEELELALRKRVASAFAIPLKNVTDSESG